MLVLALSCSSGTTSNGTSNSGGAAGEPSQPGASGAQGDAGGDRDSGAQAGETSAAGGGSSGGVGAGGVPTAEGGNANAVPGEPCAEGVQSTSSCETVDGVCALNEVSCCQCIQLASASCGKQWACAMPANNAAACPSTAPRTGAECPMAKLNCQYCAASGPLQLRCTKSSGAAAPTWQDAPLLSCAQ